MVEPALAPVSRKALIVSAHPEPQSFHAALRACAVETLAQQGYEVDISDLYAQRFKAVLDRDDFPHYPEAVFNVSLAQRHAIQNHVLPQDVALELQRLQQADLLIIMFPLWWFGMPAILKGWIDRVLVSGIAYSRRDVFERGRFKGKRALVAVTTGAPQDTFGADAIHGSMHDILQPLQRGVLAFTGMTVLPPFTGFHVPYLEHGERLQILSAWQAHLQHLDRLDPLPMPKSADRPTGPLSDEHAKG